MRTVAPHGAAEHPLKKTQNFSVALFRFLKLQNITIQNLMMFRIFNTDLLCCVLLLAGSAQAQVQRILIAQNSVNERWSKDEPPHMVVRNAATASRHLLVWLPGTNGLAAKGPNLLFDTAVQEGFQVLALQYHDSEAVSQICRGFRLTQYPDCAASFRQHRVWGAPLSPLIADRTPDAIVPRMVSVLHYLAQTDPNGAWEYFLDGDQPHWARITIAGQSQGGGMAAFIAKTQVLAGVITFSGGWDKGPDGDIASWYSRPSATPPARWHATYNVAEPEAKTLAKIYQRLQIPGSHTHALAEPAEATHAHSDGIRNPKYQPLWADMLSATLAP